MHRTASTSMIGGNTMEMDQLPTYDWQSKKEHTKVRLSENMVHVIPIVLILCAVLLWFFSHPEIDGVSKDDSIIERIKNLTIDGYSNNNSNGTAMTTGMEDLDEIDWIGKEEESTGGGEDSANKDD